MNTCIVLILKSYLATDFINMAYISRSVFFFARLKLNFIGYIVTTTMSAAVNLFDLLPDDCLAMVFALSDGTTYKSVLFTCARWCGLVRSNARLHSMKNTMCNHLVTLLNMYPDVSWNWYEISKNPNITLADVREWPDAPASQQCWDWNILAKNEFLCTCMRVCTRAFCFLQ